MINAGTTLNCLSCSPKPATLPATVRNHVHNVARKVHEDYSTLCSMCLSTGPNLAIIYRNYN